MQTTVERGLRYKHSETTDRGMERAVKILEAARDIFATEGYARLSMRGVAARAGITLGTVQHYYRTKEALFEAMLLHASEEMQAQADQVATSARGATPARQFRDAMRYFIGLVQVPAVQGTYSELKALALHDAFAAEVMERIFVRARRSIGRRIQALGPRVGEKELQVRAGLVLAQLMGLTYLDAGPRRRARSELAGLEEATLDLMLLVAQGHR